MPDIIDIIIGSAKKHSDDKEPDSDQLFNAFGYVHKDVIYDIAKEVHQLKLLADNIPEGRRDEDPLGWQLRDYVWNIAYGYQIGTRSGGSINGAYIKTIMTQHSKMQYEVINRDKKAEGMMGGVKSLLGFGGGKKPQEQPMM